MKKGINAWCFPSGYTTEQIFALARECRYDGIELNMSEPGEVPALTLGMKEADWNAVRELSSKYGLPVTSVSTSLHWSYPLTDNDVNIREKGMQVVREMLDAAAYLGCGAILVVPGLVTDEVSYKTAYERSLSAFIELRDYAESKKVIIGIENVWNKFLMSPLEMAAFIDKIGSSHVKAYFDAGNVLQFSYPEHWVEVLGERIVRVHIKDFDTSIGNITGFKPLLQGDMRWDRLVHALNSVGYDGYLTAELSPYRSNPEQLVRDTSAAMDYILAL